MTAATATATEAATDANVHLEIPGFRAFGEFHGSHVDCSADAELMARAPIDGSALTADTLNLWWREYLASGKGDQYGAQLRGIYWHLTASAHKLDPAKARVARFIDTDTTTQSKLHDAIKAALLARQTVIAFVGNASAGLAYNERGVEGHFIALGGIDSDLGYLVGNGDDVMALGGKSIIPCRWYGWNSLAMAQINGMIAIERVGGWPDLPYRQVTLPASMTWAQIAEAYAGIADNAGWVLGWNADLNSQLWWAVHAGTLVKIPVGQAPTPPSPSDDDLKQQIAHLTAERDALLARIAAAQKTLAG